MDGNETNAQPLSSSRNRKLGPIIALVVLVVVVAGGVFAYNALRQAVPSQATTSGTQGAGAASASTGEMGSGAGSDSAQATGSPSSESAYYLKDYNATVYTEQDVPLTLSEIADAKPLVINFWATWCPYCIQEMGDFQEICNEYADRVSFAFVDCVDGQRETVQKGASWMRDNGYTVPVYFDTDYSAVRAFRAANLPTTVVVAADGEILAVSVGAIDPSRMRAALDSLFAS